MAKHSAKCIPSSLLNPDVELQIEVMDDRHSMQVDVVEYVYE
jgi:hypothetical protein